MVIQGKTPDHVASAHDTENGADPDHFIGRGRHAWLIGIANGQQSRDILQFFSITHLHSDHTAGYPDLIFTPWVLGREQPLEVYGPAGIVGMTEHIQAAYECGVQERLKGLEPANQTGYQVNCHVVHPGIVYEDERVRVEAFRVQHGSLEAYGYRFITPDRIIVISGDTAPFEGLTEIYQGCDVLVHEVYAARGKRSPTWQRYHSSVHTSAHELGKIASIAGPGLLVLYHQLFHGITENELLREVQEYYQGEVVSGKDLEVY